MRTPMRAASPPVEDIVEGSARTSLGPVLDLMRLFWGLDHSMQVASKGLESRVGLTEPQRLVMMAVAETPGVSVGEVAARQRWHSATVTGIAKRLESRGIITRKTDSQDRRRRQLFLTAKGKRLAQTKLSTIEEAMTKALASVPVQAVMAAETVLLSVTQELEGMLPGI